MSTVVLDAYSKAYPSITNRLRASVFLETDPIALVASQIELAPHPQRIWHFPGLPRANYGFSLDEIDGGGAVVQNIALFSVVPGQISGLFVRADEQYQVGVTPGFDPGLSTVTFDGTSGKPDFTTWDIVPYELNGRDILVRGVDYSWDSTTGIMTWLAPGDVLQNGVWYNFRFVPKVQPGGSNQTIFDFSSRVVTETGDIETTDFGNNIVVEPDGVYIELTLPDILTIPQGRPLRIEMAPLKGSSVQCLKIIPDGADVINFLDGNLYMMNNESLEIYRLKRSDDSNEWRVRVPFGNFARVGETTSDDFTQSLVFCKQLLDGSSKSKYQYARIYNEVVLNLPPSQVCNYDDWATGNNKYLFSFANSANPANVDKFFFPDRRDLYERSNGAANKAGDYQTDLMKQFWDDVAGGVPSILSVTGLNTEIGVDNGAGSPDIKTQRLINTSIFGSEVRPKSYLINKYVLI